MSERIERRTAIVVTMMLFAFPVSCVFQAVSFALHGETWWALGHAFCGGAFGMVTVLWCWIGDEK